MLDSLTWLTDLKIFGWELRDPLFLLAVLAAPVVYLLAVRVPSSITYSSLAVPDTAPRSLRVRLARLPALLLALAAVLLAIALAGPRTGDETTRVKREGIAIIMAIDRSGSMDARDFVEGDYSISRLEALKGVFREFVQGGKAGKGRPNDLVGIVAFGTYADGICPLTLDHANLTAILDDLEVARERSEVATAIGEGLGLAVERLRKHPARSKVIILLSDGVNNAGELEPMQAAELAVAHDIQVYTIAAGVSGYVPMPVHLPDGRVRLMRQPMEVDEKTLQEIAKRTGGRYFHARDEDGLVETYREIDRMERSEITEIHYLQYHEHYASFVAAALILIALAVLAGGTYLRRLP
ncbi:MAG: VWA domain-containing protein [Gammaproteobacteria bacterium]|nr:VWA domain-containing protein [Gammaproteobacteria bacterium]